MKSNAPTITKPQGTWIHRFLIRFFTLLLTLLVFWVLGFLVDDIRSIPGPDFSTVEKKHLDPDLLAHKTDLEKEIADLTRQIANQTERQRIVGDSSRNLQQTINQLLELQKLGIQNSVDFSETEQANFTGSLDLFLENQTKYQELSRTVADILEQKQALALEMEQVERAINDQRQPALEEFDALNRKHRLKLAFLQLAILLPILGAAASLAIRKRGSIYFPLFLAFGIATLVKVSLVVHEYFPTRYFKYVFIGALLIIVARVLIYFIRTVAFPRTQWLIKQYREAYERFLCPVCEYPIRTGPRRFLFWTRRTVNKIVVPTDAGDQEEPYTCPSCGTRIFEECPSCQKVRHSMLPNCSHCGTEKALE